FYYPPAATPALHSFPTRRSSDLRNVVRRRQDSEPLRPRTHETPKNVVTTRARLSPFRQNATAVVFTVGGVGSWQPFVASSSSGQDDAPPVADREPDRAQEQEQAEHRARAEGRVVPLERGLDRRR